MIEVQWITHKGKQIAFYDLSNLLETALIEGLRKIADLQIEHEGKQVLILCDFTNTHSTPRTQKVGRELRNKVKAYKIDRKIALIGMNRFQKIIASALAKNLYFANSKEDGLDWLADQ